MHRGLFLLRTRSISFDPPSCLTPHYRAFFLSCLTHALSTDVRHTTHQTHRNGLADAHTHTHTHTLTHTHTTQTKTHTHPHSLLLQQLSNLLSGILCPLPADINIDMPCVQQHKKCPSVMLGYF